MHLHRDATVDDVEESVADSSDHHRENEHYVVVVSLDGDLQGTGGQR